jgi:hypothetical protein
MAAKKVKLPAAFNAKPVTKLGGGSSPARNPASPYKPGAGKPGRERLPLVPKPKATAAQPAAKTTIQKLQEAAKTKPNSPAPRSKVPQKALPPGNKGGALAKVTKALPAGKVPSALPAGKVGGPLAKAAGNLASRAGFVGTALQTAATANSVFNPNSDGNRQLGKALTAVNQRYAGKNGPRFKNPNSGSVASKGSSPKATFNEKAYASKQKFDVPKAKAKPASLKAAASAPAYRGSSQGSTGSSMSRSTPKPPAKAQPGQSKDMNENYRAWAAANPTLAARVKKGQAGYNAIGKDAVAGVGPVKDGSSYKPQAENTEMNASAVRRAALTASAGSVTDSDIALLDNKKKKKVNG